MAWRCQPVAAPGAKRHSVTRTRSLSISTVGTAFPLTIAPPRVLAPLPHRAGTVAARAAKRKAARPAASVDSVGAQPRAAGHLGRGARQRDVDLAGQAFGAVVERRQPVQLVGDAALDQIDPEAAARRRPDRRTAALDPAQM